MDRQLLHIFYKDGSLKTSGLYVGKLKDSTWNYYNRDSILILSEEYRKGKLNGTSQNFYNDGTLHEIKHYKNGLLDGVWKQFFIDGSLKAEANYKDGLREGKKPIIILMVKYTARAFIEMILRRELGSTLMSKV